MIKSIFRTAIGRNLYWISLLTLVESLQVLVVVVLIFSFIPIPWAPITKGVAPQLLRLFQPKRDISFYHFWVAINLLAQVVFIWFWRKRWYDSQLAQRLKPLVIVDSVWLFLQAFAAFKITQYGDPHWARGMLYITIGLSLLSRIFWSELCHYWQRREELLKSINPLIAVVVLLALVGIFGLWIFDPLQGIDKRMILLSLLYYAACFIFLRSWLQSDLMAAAGVLVMIKLQLFNLGAAPLVWLYPDRTPLAHWPDIMVFTLLLSYLRRMVWLRVWAITYLALVLIIYQGFHIEFLKNSQPLPIYFCLHYRHFFSYAMSFIIPLLYVAVLVWIIVKRVFKSDDILLIALALYGPACYARFAWVSDLYGFYWSPLALVALISFGIDRYMRARDSKLILLLLSLGALLTNVMFTFYPNLLSHFYH